MKRASTIFILLVFLIVFRYFRRHTPGKRGDPHWNLREDDLGIAAG